MGRLSRPQQEAIEAIRRRFARGVPEKVRAIEESAELVGSRGPEPELVDRLFRDAHGLAGSAAIFGFKALAEAAAALEALMLAPPVSPQQTSRWRREVASAAQKVREAGDR